MSAWLVGLTPLLGKLGLVIEYVDEDRQILEGEKTLTPVELSAAGKSSLLAAMELGRI